MATETTSLYRARVPANRLRKAEEILAQIELREGLPFEVSTRPPVLLNSEPQAAEWQEAFSAYGSQTLRAGGAASVMRIGRLIIEDR